MVLAVCINMLALALVLCRIYLFFVNSFSTTPVSIVHCVRLEFGTSSHVLASRNMRIISDKIFTTNPIKKGTGTEVEANTLAGTSGRHIDRLY